MSSSRFDAHADAYDADLAHGISVSGEDKHYFARGRVEWLAQCLRGRNRPAGSVLDFGCGTGTAASYLLELPGAAAILGVDRSLRSLEIARQTQGSDRVRFATIDEVPAAQRFALAFCNGVFHHVPPRDRAAELGRIYSWLEPGGWFAFWENNPWNPGARYVMSRIPFDRDAEMIFPHQARRLLREAGFEILRTDYLFVFPRVLRWLRRFEPTMSGIPAGAQYQVLCRRP